MERLEDVFVGLGFTVAEGPEVEDRLVQLQRAQLRRRTTRPATCRTRSSSSCGEPARRSLLRTHTSPVQIRVMTDQPPPIYIGHAGAGVPQRHARRHAHAGVPPDRGPGGRPGHHLRPTWPARSRRSPRRSSAADFASRLRPSYFPFTEPSAEFDIQRPDGSVARARRLRHGAPERAAQLRHRPRGVAGFAFGFGIDRLAARAPRRRRPPRDVLERHPLPEQF